MLYLTPFTSKAQNDKDQIISIMKAQENAWNEGNLTAYMAGYWHSEQLRFVGKNGIKFGWQATLDNYKKSYSTKEKMGTLKFNNIDIEVTESTAFVLGKWQITLKEDVVSGYNSLFWKKIDNKWRIVIDHSS
ncbi:hypothetical protein PTD2_02816 [Pseudoalteromonas tunicata D2]|uniref:DUF4440 domain-containing protein n=2 Tax=Pseudoalteromonas tunicata TaxID=314281 RepID=A4C4I4_9GAMM|nr:hypothetical protein PTD2_02816 [Pseudoalteromonas tunicata D2]